MPMKKARSRLRAFEFQQRQSVLKEKRRREDLHYVLQSQ